MLGHDQRRGWHGRAAYKTSFSAARHLCDPRHASAFLLQAQRYVAYPVCFLEQFPASACANDRVALCVERRLQTPEYVTVWLELR